MIRLISKKNGKNYYGLEEGKDPIEIVKQGGYFYRTKYVIGEGLRPIGVALKKSEYSLEE